MTKSVIQTLNQTNLLKNSLIAFTADHGETPGRGIYRISAPDIRVLSVPLWFHIPKNLISKEKKEILIENGKFGTISNLDVVPTLIDILNWANVSNLFSNSNHTIHGQSLLSPLPSNRIILGWQGKPFVTFCDWQHLYLANQTHVLFIHPKGPVLEMGQSKNVALLRKSWSWSELNEKEREKWSFEWEKYPFLIEIMNECNLLKFLKRRRERMNRKGFNW